MSGVACADRLMIASLFDAKLLRLKTAPHYFAECSGKQHTTKIYPTGVGNASRHIYVSLAMPRWNGKLYCRSFVLVLCSPKRSPVGLDDPSTNRKPQARACWFSGQQRVVD